MSNNRIFSTVRFQNHGRTVNLSNNILKLSTVFINSQPQILQPSPFANYNCKLNESNVSESTLQQQRITQDLIRQIAKEEISKMPKPQETNRKVIATLQAQIADLREKMGQNERETSKKIQQASLTVKQDIRSQGQKIGKEVQVQISSKLRLFFQKVNAELKKDILKCVQEDYLSMAYGDDLQNRLQSISQKLQGLSSQSNTVQKEVNKHLPEDMSHKLNSAQREIQNWKKSVAALNQRIQVLQEFKRDEQVNKRLMIQKEDKLQDLVKKVNEFQRHFSKSNQQMLINLQANLKELKQMNHHVFQLQKKNDSQKLTLMDLTKTLSSKDSSSDSTLGQSNLKIAQNQSLLFQNNSYVGESKQKKQMYQVDKEGYLMDGEGKYLLTATNSLIKLSNEQISALIESSVIEIVEK